MLTVDTIFGRFSEFVRLKWSAEAYLSIKTAKLLVDWRVCSKQYMDIDFRTQRPHLNINKVIIKTYEPQRELTFVSTGL